MLAVPMTLFSSVISSAICHQRLMGWTEWAGVIGESYTKSRPAGSVGIMA
jgi:hypothetical protein